MVSLIKKMKLLKQIILPVLLLTFVSFNFAFAGFSFGDNTGLNNTAGKAEFATGGDVGTKADIAGRVGDIASIAISFVGVIFMVLILMGSFELTSSAGNDQQVQSGKKKIKNGAIGILIVFGAYLVSQVVVGFISGKGMFQIFNI